MRYIFLALCLCCWWTCQRETVTPTVPQPFLQFDFVAPDGSSTTIVSDSVSFVGVRSTPHLAAPLPDPPERVRLQGTARFALPTAAGENHRSFDLHFSRSAVPIALLQPAADSSHYVFEEPSDWIDRFFSAEILALDNSYRVELMYDALWLVNFGAEPQSTEHLTYTSVESLFLPTGEKFITVSGTFELSVDRWFTIPGEGPWELRNGVFTFTVDITHLYP